MKMSQIMRRHWNNVEWRKRMLALRNSKEYRKKQSDSHKEAAWRRTKREEDGRGLELRQALVC